MNDDSDYDAWIAEIAEEVAEEGVAMSNSSCRLLVRGVLRIPHEQRAVETETRAQTARD